LTVSPREAREDAGTELQLRPELPVRKPRPRLASDDYVGRRTYHITLTTWRRLPHFEDLAAASACEVQLLEAASRARFKLLAYCFMPDHLHVLLRGLETNCNLLRFVQRFKQMTAFHFKRRLEMSLWQQSFFDRVLRSDEDARSVAEYILANPADAELPEGAVAYQLRGGEFYRRDAHRTELKLRPYIDSPLKSQRRGRIERTSVPTPKAVMTHDQSA
jgi:putative transposase